MPKFNNGESAASVRQKINDAIDKVDGVQAISDADITGGTIDNTVIGGVTPAAGTFSSATINGNITVTGTVDGRDIAADGSKLDGIEAGADVTDATNVEAAGAVMESDTTTAAMSFVIDEDTMVSNLDTKVPTQQSVKAYVDGRVASSVEYAGGYNAATNTPDLDTSPSGITKGDMYTVTAAGTFFTIGVEIGDVLISEVDNPSVESDWTIVNKNLDAASIKTAYESNADTNAFTDAEQTKLSGIEAGADVTDTANVTAAGALMDSELTNITAVKALDQGVATTDSPTFAGGTFTGNVSFGDNDKAIFGAGSDLQIYHDGTQSFIQDVGTGDLRLASNGSGVFINKGTSENMAKFLTDGAVELYYDQGTYATYKLATTATGVDITGTINIDSTSFDPASGWGASQNVSPAGLNFEDNGTTVGSLLGQTYKTDSVSWSTTRLSGFFGMEKTNAIGNGDFVWWLAPTNYAQNPSQKMRIASNGNISFYEDTGSTPKMVWSASDESLVVGASSTATVFEATGSKNDQWAGKFTNTNTGGYGVLAITAGSTADEKAFEVRKNTSDTAMLIDGLGKVGIGTSSPQRILHTSGDIVRFDNNGTSAILLLDTTNNEGFRIVTNRDSGAFSIEDMGTATSGAGTERMRISSGGDISFYEDTGTTPKFFWDASAESLLIGTYNGAGTPSGSLFVDSNANNHAIHIEETGGGSESWQIGVNTDGDLGFYNSQSTTASVTFDDSGNVGIGGSPAAGRSLHVQGAGFQEVIVEKTDATTSAILLSADTGVGSIYTRSTASDSTAIPLSFHTGNTERMRLNSDGSVYWKPDGTTQAMTLDASGNLLVGKTSLNATDVGIVANASGRLWVTASSDDSIFNRTTTDGSIVSFRKDGTTVGSIGANGGDVYIGTGDTGIRFVDSLDCLLPLNTSTNATRDAAIDIGYNDGGRFKDLYLSGGLRGDITFKNNAGTTEYARFDASGNLLVGKTSAGYATDGFEARAAGYASVSDSGATPFLVNRNTDDGNLIAFYKAGAAVGSIGTASGDLTISSSGSNPVRLQYNGNSVAKVESGSLDPANDNTQDLGQLGVRWDDIYATNGTIQTSDEREKQDIDVLSDAEQRVAVAAKGLLRKFRWKDAVAEKGDDARIHFGIIAQDLQAAFEAEGLDAGRYGMFIHTTWTDEETGEERSRMGVRYSELLAFIVAAI